MRGILTFAAALLVISAASQVHAQDRSQVVEIEIIDSSTAETLQRSYPEDAIIEAADAFFEALGSEDKTALATMMVPEGTIFVHNRMDPANPRVDIVPVADHLARWARGTRSVSERMFYQRVYMSGDLGYVEGPYSFSVEGQVSHCGVNHLSMVKTEEGWKVGNTSFTMVPPVQCEIVGADWVDQ